MFPDADALHYFTVHFDQGEQWYTRHYSDYAGERVVGDTTPSYAGFDWSRRRLADFNPDAKILITLRNPIDRAFSHYFHMKQKRGYPKRFQEVLENKADLFQWLIAMGFYGHHLTDLFRYFAREQVCVMSYDLLVSDPRTFCRQVFDFLEIDSSFFADMRQSEGEFSDKVFKDHSDKYSESFSVLPIRQANTMSALPGKREHG